VERRAGAVVLRARRPPPLRHHGARGNGTEKRTNTARATTCCVFVCICMYQRECVCECVSEIHRETHTHTEQQQATGHISVCRSVCLCLSVSLSVCCSYLSLCSRAEHYAPSIAKSFNLRAREAASSGQLPASKLLACSEYCAVRSTSHPPTVPHGPHCTVPSSICTSGEQTWRTDQTHTTRIRYF
jgi:hypothetical protein